MRRYFGLRLPSIGVAPGGLPLRGSVRGTGSATTAAVDASAAVDGATSVPAPEAGCELMYADHSSTSRWTIDHLGGGGGGGGVASLRQMLIEAGHPPYNHPATAVNCRGIGTCGTCAVEVRVLTGPGTSPLTLREKLRLRLPPHSAAAAAAAAGETSPGKVTIRLSCQTQVLPGSSVEVRKHGGMWGQLYMPTPNHNATATATATAAVPVPTKLGGGFDLDLIMSATPYPKWLLGEMRSNQAGETGAVAIYRGCRAALDLRSRLGQTDARGHEARLRAFADEHEMSEREHLVLLNNIIARPDRSGLLRVWRFAGFSLGFVATLFSPRQMYVTTDAVESFVEEHYGYQIDRIARADHDGEVWDGEAAAELLRMLEYCREDEIHHKEEARGRAAEESRSTVGHRFDAAWRWLVMTGSDHAANLAKRF